MNESELLDIVNKQSMLNAVNLTRSAPTENSLKKKVVVDALNKQYLEDFILDKSGLRELLDTLKYTKEHIELNVEEISIDEPRFFEQLYMWIKKSNNIEPTNDYFMSKLLHQWCLTIPFKVCGELLLVVDDVDKQKVLDFLDINYAQTWKSRFRDIDVSFEYRRNDFRMVLSVDDDNMELNNIRFLVNMYKVIPIHLEVNQVWPSDIDDAY